MVMGENEILVDYRTAKDKKEQVKILADRNLVKPREMAQWLKDHGEDVDGRYFASGKVAAKVKPIEPAPAKLTREELDTRMERADQAAKADAGKPRLTLVPRKTETVIARLEEFDQKSEAMMAPKMICKTRKDGGDWKALFECPYCGSEFEAYVSNIISGRQRSCGCAKGRLSVAAKGTHGASKTRLYRIWAHIKERCNNPNCKEYKWYGARGITYEFENFEAFRDYAFEHGYSDDLTCERIDVDGNYAPGNITFIPLQLQARNTRSNVMITYKGLTLCAAEWAEIMGVNQNTITKRIRSGWSDERTIETPVNGSVDMSLVPVEAIKAIRAVRLFGCSKYGDPDNWKTVDPARYRDALLRHLFKYVDDPGGVDEESGLPHLWHGLCDLVPYGSEAT